MASLVRFGPKQQLSRCLGYPDSRVNSGVSNRELPNLLLLHPIVHKPSAAVPLSVSWRSRDLCLKTTTRYPGMPHVCAKTADRLSHFSVVPGRRPVRDAAWEAKTSYSALVGRGRADQGAWKHRRSMTGKDHGDHQRSSPSQPTTREQDTDSAAMPFLQQWLIGHGSWLEQSRRGKLCGRLSGHDTERPG